YHASTCRRNREIASLQGGGSIPAPPSRSAGVQRPARTIRGMAPASTSHAGLAGHVDPPRRGSSSMSSPARAGPQPKESPMSYIDGFVMAVPDSNKKAFIDHATRFDALFLEFGATRVMECW